MSASTGRDEGSEMKQGTRGEDRTFFISRLASLQYLVGVCLCLVVIIPDGLSVGLRIFFIGALVGLSATLLLVMVKPVLRVGPGGFKFLWFEPFDWHDIRQIVYFNVRGLASMKVTIDRAVLMRPQSRVARLLLRAAGQHLWFRGSLGVDLEQLTDAIREFYEIEEVF